MKINILITKPELELFHSALRNYQKVLELRFSRSNIAGQQISDILIAGLTEREKKHLNLMQNIGKEG